MAHTKPDRPAKDPKIKGTVADPLPPELDEGDSAETDAEDLAAPEAEGFDAEERRPL